MEQISSRSVTSNAVANQTSNNQASNIPPFSNFTQNGNITQNNIITHTEIFTPSEKFTQSGNLTQNENSQNEDFLQNNGSQNGLTDITHVLATSVFPQANNYCNQNNDKLPNSKECGCKETYTPEDIDALIRKPYYYIKCNHKQHIF